MDGIEHVTDLARLRSCLQQRLRYIFGQSATSVGNDQLHARDAAVGRVAQESGPAGLIFFGILTDAQNLAEPFGIDSARHRQ